jgi:hypothetical protein
LSIVNIYFLLDIQQLSLSLTFFYFPPYFRYSHPLIVHSWFPVELTLLPVQPGQSENGPFQTTVARLHLTLVTSVKTTKTEF